jgi:hypothetical protein
VLNFKIEKLCKLVIFKTVSHMNPRVQMTLFSDSKKYLLPNLAKKYSTVYLKKRVEQWIVVLFRVHA